MADIGIVNRNVAAAPKDYTIQGGQEILLKAVRANIDGTAATQPFLVDLQLLTPDGTVMWDAVTPSTIAAGASVAVSWFPDVEGAPAAAASSSSAGITDLTSSGGSLTVTNPTGPTTNADVAASGVTASTYGDATHVPQFTVGADGRITAAQVFTFGGGGAAGGILSVKQYGPGTLANYSVTGTTLTAVDSTNLTCSFTVPTSGQVVVEFEAAMEGDGSSGLVLGLLNHTGGAQLGFTSDNVIPVAAIYRLSNRWFLTGLSGGSALQVDVAACLGAAGGTGHIFAQGHTGAGAAGKTGPATIVVHAA